MSKGQGMSLTLHALERWSLESRWITKLVESARLSSALAERIRVARNGWSHVDEVSRDFSQRAISPTVLPLLRHCYDFSLIALPLLYHFKGQCDPLSSKSKTGKKSRDPNHISDGTVGKKVENKDLKKLFGLWLRILGRSSDQGDWKKKRERPLAPRLPAEIGGSS
ncbi:hypothetical protein VNO77_15575 [Canavalia gladiata]|uniref:Uncharacterized protein n=1 Tax=Canavalia gladiata TaxID=3824 RepID=A0AAN9M449_CANGL